MSQCFLRKCLAMIGMSPQFPVAAPSERERLYSGEFDRRAVDIFENHHGKLISDGNFAMAFFQLGEGGSYVPRRGTPWR
jgi:hypothetical protein